MKIGYFISENFGVATEAVSDMLRYIQDHFDVARIYAEVFASDKASMKVLQKTGFTPNVFVENSSIRNNKIMDDYIWVKLLEF